MVIENIGVVFNGGCGSAALHAALAAGVAPQPQPLPSEGLAVMAVSAATLNANPALAPARRADRYCRMVMAAALEAWQGSEAAPQRVGIILATALGPHATVFRYVNDLLDYGAARTSPTVFSQSVHAAATSMVAAAIGARGPVLNIADLAFPFEEALRLAGCWLEAGRCDVVLAGAVEEISAVYAHVARRKWAAPALGEGAVFFRLSRAGGLAVSVAEAAVGGAAAALHDPLALGGGKSAADGAMATHTAHWGASRLGGAFNLAAAWLCRESGGAVEITATCGGSRRVVRLGAADNS